jgi:hypothetical protein
VVVVSIEEHADAAARLVADDNEAAPTSIVGIEVRVNPSVGQVLAAIESQPPGLLVVDAIIGDGTSGPQRSPLKMTRWSSAIIPLFISLLARASGRGALNGGLDGFNGAMYFALEAVRRSRHVLTRE